MLEKIKKFIKNNYIGIIIIALVIVVFYVPLDYEIETDGGLIDLTKRIEVTPSHDMEGSINLTYVGGRRGTPFMLFLSAILSNWDSYKTEDILIDNETYQEQLKRAKVALKESEQNATYVALKNAGKYVEITRYDLTVIHIESDADTSIEVGDILLSADGIKIDKYEDLEKIINSYEIGDTIKMQVKRKEQTKEVYAKIRSEEDRKIIGIYINPIIELKYDENIKIEFDTVANAYGSSGGLMNSLLIYNRLTEEDITKGKTISGTGVINIDGSVEAIDGVKYKLRGAYKKGADIFIVPSDNYEEALSIKKEYDMDIDIIEAISFEQVLNELKER